MEAIDTSLDVAADPVDPSIVQPNSTATNVTIDPVDVVDPVTVVPIDTPTNDPLDSTDPVTVIDDPTTVGPSSTTDTDPNSVVSNDTLPSVTDPVLDPTSNDPESTDTLDPTLPVENTDQPTDVVTETTTITEPDGVTLNIPDEELMPVANFSTTLSMSCEPGSDKYCIDTFGENNCCMNMTIISLGSDMTQNE